MNRLCFDGRLRRDDIEGHIAVAWCGERIGTFEFVHHRQLHNLRSVGTVARLNGRRFVDFFRKGPRLDVSARGLGESV